MEAAHQCAKNKKDRKEWKALVHMYLKISFTLPFCLAQYSFGLPSRALVVIAKRGVGCPYMMRLE